MHNYFKRRFSLAALSSAGADEVPQHQGEKQDRWVYPSEAQFYNAMRRKGWPAEPGDMQNIVAIHNGVNERAWHQILKYEVPSCS